LRPEEPNTKKMLYLNEEGHFRPSLVAKVRNATLLASDGGGGGGGAGGDGKGGTEFICPFSDGTVAEIAAHLMLRNFFPYEYKGLHIS
jgi:hypothetical protein